jgi:S1-C subfamily serine protease
VFSLLGGGPAAQAGITSGSTITAVNGAQVATAQKLHDLLSGLKPGQRVSISWTGPDGASHAATVTLATGPAD